jgi:hypothetical protein
VEKNEKEAQQDTGSFQVAGRLFSIRAAAPRRPPPQGVLVPAHLPDFDDLHGYYGKPEGLAVIQICRI